MLLEGLVKESGGKITIDCIILEKNPNYLIWCGEMAVLFFC